MMMRPRNYSVLNRSIARGVGYALRDSNMKKYRKNTNNIKQDIGSEVNITIWIIAFILVICCLINS